METAVVKKLNVSASKVVLMRLSLMILAGFIYGTLIGGVTL